MQSRRRLAGGGLAQAFMRKAMSAIGDLGEHTVAPMGALSVVKPRGGQWLDNSVPKALKPLIKEPAEKVRPGNIVKAEPGADDPNYTMYHEVNPETGHVVSSAFTHNDVGSPFELNPKDKAVNDWINGALTKYIKNRMGTPDDEIRQYADKQRMDLVDQVAADRAKYEDLAAKADAEKDPRVAAQLRREAEDGIAQVNSNHMLDTNHILHVPTNQLEYMRPSPVRASRIRNDNGVRFGFPIHNTASSMVGSSWEDAADAVIGSSRTTPRKYLAPEDPSKMLPVEGDPSKVVGPEYGSVFPSWLTKIDPKTSIYGLNLEGNTFGNKFTDLFGWDHLSDSLRGALADRTLRPDNLSKLSVLDAVKLTAARNKQAEIDSAKAVADAENNLPIHKDYADGMKWVKLGPKEIDNLAPGEDKAVSRALDQEGRVMGHCVGGYCDDVMRGTSEIYSLRDANNQPHVTIETSPGDYTLEDARRANDHDAYDGILGGLRDELARRPTIYGDAGETGEHDLEHVGERGMRDHNGIMKYLKNFHPDLYTDYGSNPDNPRNIVQIKGKGNGKPVDKYLPYVQDFVKSGVWNQVNDLPNSGLIQHEGGFADPVHDPIYRMDPTGHYFPGDTYSGLNPATVLQSGFAPPNADGSYSLANLHEHLQKPETQRSIKDQFIDSLHDYYQRAEDRPAAPHEIEDEIGGLQKNLDTISGSTPEQMYNQGQRAPRFYAAGGPVLMTEHEMIGTHLLPAGQGSRTMFPNRRVA